MGEFPVTTESDFHSAELEPKPDKVVSLNDVKYKLEFLAASGQQLTIEAALHYLETAAEPIPQKEILFLSRKLISDVFDQYFKNKGMDLNGDGDGDSTFDDELYASTLRDLNADENIDSSLLYYGMRSARPGFNFRKLAAMAKECNSNHADLLEKIAADVDRLKESGRWPDAV